MKLMFAVAPIFSLLFVASFATADSSAPSPEKRMSTCNDGTSEEFRPGVCKDHGGVAKARPTIGCADGTRDVFSDHICAGQGGTKKP